MVEHQPDAPFPWRVPGREDSVHYFQEISSTMDKARELALAGCPSMTVVAAETQTRGRGRLERQWDSQAGGLYFTLVIRPDLPPENCFRLNFLASVSLARILRHLCGIEARIKWPNDILVENRKLAGMLSEINVTGHQARFMTIGIGINVNNDPTHFAPESVSLFQLLGGTTSRLSLFSEFLDGFEAGLEALPDTDILGEWKKLAIPMNRKAVVVTSAGKFEGVAEDVDSEGALILKLDDGARKRVLYGDCFM